MWCSSPATPTSIIRASRWPCWDGCWRARAFAWRFSASPIGDPASHGETFGRPRLFFAISAGNMDSMINHYTANRKVRNDDAYSPGGQIGRRPDRATLAYCQRAREAYQGRAGDRRRRRGQLAAARPLRLLERQGPPLDPAGRQGRSAGLRHGRAADRRDRSAAGGGRDACAICATSAAWPIGWERANRRPTEDTITLPSYEQVATDKRAFCRHDEDCPSGDQSAQRQAAGAISRAARQSSSIRRRCRSRRPRWIASTDCLTRGSRIPAMAGSRSRPTRS